MDAKSFFKKAGEGIHNLIYAIGCLSIASYSLDHWPRETKIVCIAGGAAYLVWYLWQFFFRPFRLALKGGADCPSVRNYFDDLKK